MNISGINNYGYSLYYKVNKDEKDVTKSISSEKVSVSPAAKSAGEANSRETQKYLEDLQKKNSQINLMSGMKNLSISKNSNSKTDVIIAPSILAQMAADPKAAQKYEKMLADIPALDKWADSAIHAMTGNEVKYRQVWIDENGDMGSFCISGPSEKKLMAEAQAKKEKQEEYEKRIQERREKTQEFQERLKGGDKTPAELAYADSISKLIGVNCKA